MTHGRAGLPQQLRDLGLPLRTAGISALRRLVCHVPALVIADALGSAGSEGGILSASRDVLLLEPGCGEDCEYGCRTY
jgi:hypothetical protein